MAVVADGEITKRLKSPEDFGGALSVSQYIIDRLTKQNLAWKQKMVPRNLSPHPCNRGGYGVNVESVHTLGADIAQVGWCWEALGSSSLCVEDCPQSKYIEEYNKALCATTDLLAPIEPCTIKAGTLTNGHTVLFLRALAAGTKTASEILSVNGHMNLSHMKQTDPAMGVAAEEGWTWVVLHHSTRALYGDALFELLSDARNINLQRNESEVQVMLKMWTAADKHRQLEPTEPVPWDNILKSVLRTKPACSQYASVLMNFIKHYGQFATDFSKFHSRYCPNERIVLGNFYEGLDAVTIKDPDTKKIHPAVFFRWATLKTQYLCPEAKVVSRECKFLSRSDVESIGRKSPKDVINAEGVLSTARVLLVPLTALGEEVRSRLLAKLDTSVIRVLFDKQQLSKQKFKTVYAAGLDFFSELCDACKACGCDPLPANPWETMVVKSNSSEDTPASVGFGDGVQSFTEAGALIPIDTEKWLKSCGFEVGSEVADRSDKNVKYSIVSIGAIVNLTSTEADDVEVEAKEFLNKWKLFGEENYPFGTQNHAPTNQSFIINSLKSTICMALGVTATVYAKPEVRLQSKPSKRVFATTSYKSGGCVLLPDTTSIVWVEPGAKVSNNIVEVFFKPKLCVKQRFFVSQPVMST